MNRDKLSELLLSVGPLLHKKLNKALPHTDISRQQCELLFHICLEDGKTMKHYGERLMIPKSNLTILADKLIEEKLIVREAAPDDRRVILLRITEEGKAFMHEQRLKFKQALIKKFEVLSDQDIDKLNEIFEDMIVIFNKLDH